MASRLLISTLVLVLMSVVSTFPERKSSLLSGSRSVNGLRPNAIGGSMIYSVPIREQEVVSGSGMDSSSKTVGVGGEGRSGEKRSEDESAMFDRKKRDPSRASTIVSVLYDRIRSCVRSGMGLQFLTESNVRCAIKNWVRVFRVKERIQCKNCEP